MSEQAFGWLMVSLLILFALVSLFTGGGGKKK